MHSDQPGCFSIPGSGLERPEAAQKHEQPNKRSLWTPIWLRQFLSCFWFSIPDPRVYRISEPETNTKSETNFEQDLPPAVLAFLPACLLRARPLRASFRGPAGRNTFGCLLCQPQSFSSSSASELPTVACTTSLATTPALPSTGVCLRAAVVVSGSSSRVGHVCVHTYSALMAAPAANWTAFAARSLRQL